MTYRPDIDGLRALAVLPVVLYHLGIPAFSGGYVGVDVFFVISGYLITGIIWREVVQGNFSIVGFYERRARRILPALFVVIGFSTAFGLFIFTPEELVNFAKSLLGSIFFVQNFVLGAESGYFDAASETKPLLHIWSLAVEEQFYIFFPLALMLVGKRVGRVRVLWFLLAAIAASLAMSIYFMSSRPTLNFYMLPLRAWELLVGSFLAIGLASGKVQFPRFKHVLSLLGLAAILLPVFMYSSNTSFPGYTAVPPVLGAAAIIWAGPQSVVGRCLSIREVVFVGLISYSLYLWHWPLFAFHALLYPENMPALHAVALFSLSVGLAVISWRYVETPFRTNKVSVLNRKAIFAGSAFATACFAVFAVLVFLGKGWEWRASPEVIALANVANEKRISDSQCKPEIYLFTLRGRERGFCTLGKQTVGKPDVLVWGDSHVGAWFPALDQAFKEAGISGYAISMAGCPIAFGLERAEKGKDGCGQAADAVKHYIQTEGIGHVLIVGSWFGVLEEKNTVFDGNASYDNPSRLMNVSAGIAHTGQALRSFGAKSAFFLTVPGARHSVPEALFRQARLGFYPEIRRTPEEYENKLGNIKEVARKNFDAVFTLNSPLCGNDFCEVLMDGKPLYYDSNHPSLYLNQVMVPHLSAQIQAFRNQ